MLIRFRSIPTGWVLGLGLLLVAFSALIPLRAADRVRLGRDVLALSRGGNPDNVLTQSSCDALHHNASCAVLGVGAICDTCTSSTYTNVIPGDSGGYTQKGLATTCGNNESGICPAGGGDCPGGTYVGGCSFTPWIIVQAN